MAPAPVRLTRRGRVVVLLAALAVALVAMVTLGGMAIATRDGGTPPPVHVVEVQPGDTLYAIAGQIAKPGHVRDMVQQIEDLNSLPDASLQAGQKLALPVQ
jgi:predicted Zn-dependent protease